MMADTDSLRPEIAPLVVNGHTYNWRWEPIYPAPERSPPPWRRRAPPPPPFERLEVDVAGLQLVTWCVLGESSWRLRATLPSSSSAGTGWIPAPGPVSDPLRSQDGYATLADVREMAQWLAVRFARANPPPRSIEALAGWEIVHASDPRLAGPRAAHCDALWWCRAVSEYYNGRETRDVKRAWRARERAYEAYRSAWDQLRLDAIVKWRRDRHRAGLLARLEAVTELVNMLSDEELDAMLNDMLDAVEEENGT